MSGDSSKRVLPVIVGVDVGGTNTDVAVLHTIDAEPEVISADKELTSADVTTGVRNAVYKALKQATDSGHNIDVVQVNIGTTHFVNATVQGKGLAKVAVIRLCGTASKALPPFSDFPTDLKEVICGSVHLCDGGYRVDGREIDPINEREISAIISEIKSTNIKNIVLSGIFSPVRPDQEDRVLKMIHDQYPEASVTLSHKIGYIGLLERENAAILNECLKPLCKTTIQGFRTALESINVFCPMYLTQNDGTIISSEDAMSYPIYTFASGPTNSMRGAAFLSDVKDAVVIDIGGTTTEVGFLKNGFPREASTQVKLGRVRTNVRMPDVLSIGLGGGSYVQENTDDEDKLCSVTIGPLSAGYNLKNEALIFGSGTDAKSRKLTTTDIAVAAGLLHLGNPNNVSHLPTDLVKMTLATMVRMLEDAIDMIKLSRETLPVILIGGGSLLVDVHKKQKIKGASDLIVPKFSGVANAIGAALSQVSGSVDNVVCLQDMIDKDQMEFAEKQSITHIIDDPLGQKAEIAMEKARRPFFAAVRDVAIEKAISKAKDLAVSAGADPAYVEVTEKDIIPLTYIPGHATRIKIKAVGNLNKLKLQGTPITQWTPGPESTSDQTQSTETLEKQRITSTGQTLTEEQYGRDAKKHPVEPHIDASTGEWILSEWDIEAIVIGAGILGCGGGGNPHIGRLMTLAAIRKGKIIRVVTPDRLFKNADPVNDFVGVPGYMGAPLVTYEQLVSSTETIGALSCQQDLYEVGGYHDGVLTRSEGVEIKSKDGVEFIENYKPKSRKVKMFKALMSSEIGGLNAMEPLIVSADLGIPVVDCDGMGRAFPELQMFVPYMYDFPPYPVTMVDDKGTRSVVLKSPTAKQVESHFRDVVIQMGCAAGMADAPLNKTAIMERTVLYSVSHAWRLGNAVLRARIGKNCPVKAILDTVMSVHILSGKIRDIQRETSGGFNIGKVIIEGLDEFSTKTIKVEFQNENLVIFPLDQSQTPGEAIASVPDLIAIVDADTAEPIPTEEVKYGMRVAVLVLASPDILRTEQALRYVGPQGFHYDNVQFNPIGNAYPVEPVPPKN